MGLISNLTSPEFASLVNGQKPVAVLIPVGSVEPHGPHLPLATDTIISTGAIKRAIAQLDAHEIIALEAPAVPYGVTECAAQFPGTVSIEAATLTAYLRSVTKGFLSAGVTHVCLVNNHLEPEHDVAVRAVLEGLEPNSASVACPLSRRWARTLSQEFKSGECHAGRYETAIVMAETPELVNEAARTSLPYVPVSLSEQLIAGVSDFKEMGMENAYAGAPAAATQAEGDDLLNRLATMVATTVSEAINAQTVSSHQS